MYDEIIRKIIESVDKNLTIGAYPKFSEDSYKAHIIDLVNFHEINPIFSNKKVAFVDGGNAELVASANFSLHLIRVCYAIYQNRKRIAIKKFEIFAFVHAVNRNNEIYYKTSLFNTKNDLGLGELSFSSLDRTLMSGINRADISSVASAVRRFAELRLAELVSREKLADIIVLDGNLQSTFTGENNFLNELYDSCARNSVVLTALSKTSSLFTDDGNLFSAVLQAISPLASWFYHPIVDISNTSHQAEMLFAKFHEKSKHVFRFEIFDKQKAMSEETINIIANSCIDPIFLGYPYGLVEADRTARVSNNERDMLRTMILVKLKNKNIEKYLSSRNAHEILDRMSF